MHRATAHHFLAVEATLSHDLAGVSAPWLESFPLPSGKPAAAVL